MKKVLSLISLMLVIVMTAACFVSCGGGKTEDTQKPAEQTNAQETKGEATQAATEAPTAAATEAPTEPATEAPTEPVTEEPQGQQFGESSLQIVGDTIYIGTREQLFEFAQLANDFEDFCDLTVKLTADIDLNPELEGGKHWTPISGENLLDFTFDGDGHVINGMWIDYEDVTYELNDVLHGYGFFGAVFGSIMIKNVTFNNCTMNPTTKHAGCVIGTIERGDAYVEIDNVTVNNLYLNGGVGSEGDTAGICFRAGGIVGADIASAPLIVTNCTVSDSKIIGFHNIAGVVGCANYGCLDIENCKVINTELHYSASYAKSYKDPQLSRYFADIFHEENSYWGFYHTDEDLANGNTYENVKSYDIKNDIFYENEEGKTMSYYDLMGVEEFPVSGSVNTRDPR